MAALRPFGLEVKATDGSTTRGSTRVVEPSRPIVLTERGDTVTENALMAAALHPGTTIIRNASSNYMVQDLCFFLQKLGVAGRRHRDDHAHRHRSARDRRRRRLRPERGPHRGDVPARRRDRHRVRDHHPSGADRVPRDRARDRSRRWASATTCSDEYLARNERTRLVDITTAAACCTRRWTRSTRCRSPASTSTTCRSSRSSRPPPKARPCCTTGSTRTAPSTSSSSTSWAATSSSSTRTG